MQPRSLHSLEPSASDCHPHCSAGTGSPLTWVTNPKPLPQPPPPWLLLPGFLAVQIQSSSYLRGCCSFSSTCNYHLNLVFPKNLSLVLLLLLTTGFKWPSSLHHLHTPIVHSLNSLLISSLRKPWHHLKCRIFKTTSSFFPNLLGPPIEPNIQVTQSPDLRVIFPLLFPCTLMSVIKFSQFPLSSLFRPLLLSHCGVSPWNF